MDQMTDRRCRRAVGAIAASAAIAFGLGACGSSSSSSTVTTQANAAATSTAAKGASGGGSSQKGAPRRAGEVRECLQRNGVKLPAGRGAGGAFLGGGPPKGVDLSKLRTAMRKCLGQARPFGAVRRAGALRANNPRFRKALDDFAACMRRNGVKVPVPNTSGNGPVFSTKGLNTASARFKAAAAKCRPALSAGFGRPGAAAPQPNG